MTFLPEKVTFFALFLRMKKARKPDKINVFGLAGDSETRTHDPLNAIQVLSQLSYTPKRCRYLITYLINMQVDFCITANFLGKVATIQTGCSYTPSPAKSIHLREKNIAGPTERSAMHVHC